MLQSTTLPDTAELANWQAEDARYYRDVLHGLIDMGMDLARAVHRQVADQREVAGVPGGVPIEVPVAVELSVAFERISRAVRRTVLLARAVAEPVGVGEERRRLGARRRIVREVEDAIGRGALDEGHAAGLQAELTERLEDPELDDDIAGRDVAEVIVEICRDLGVASPGLGVEPWQRRTPAEVRALGARAAGVVPAGGNGAGVVVKRLQVGGSRPGWVGSPALATILAPPGFHPTG